MNHPTAEYIFCDSSSISSRSTSTSSSSSSSCSSYDESLNSDDSELVISPQFSSDPEFEPDYAYPYYDSDDSEQEEPWDVYERQLKIRHRRQEIKYENFLVDEFGDGEGDGDENESPTYVIGLQFTERFAIENVDQNGKKSYILYDIQTSKMDCKDRKKRESHLVIHSIILLLIL